MRMVYICLRLLTYISLASINLMPVTSFANQLKTVQIDSRANQFDIILSANPTTGFQWTVKQYDHTFLMLKGSRFVPPAKGLMGAKGTMVFTFNKIGNKPFPETSVMQFRYARSWESTGGQVSTLLVRFQEKNTTSD